VMTTSEDDQGEERRVERYPKQYKAIHGEYSLTNGNNWTARKSNGDWKPSLTSLTIWPLSETKNVGAGARLESSSVVNMWLQRGG
jgi:hypothetical protein